MITIRVILHNLTIKTYMCCYDKKGVTAQIYLTFFLNLAQETGRIMCFSLYLAT